MNKPSEIQVAFTKLQEAMKGMAKDAKGWKVSDIAAVYGMKTAIINLKQELLNSQDELATLKASLPKIKADAVLSLLNTSYTCETPNGDSAWSSDAIEEYANKLEAGE